jgi:hypothetical protein
MKGEHPLMASGKQTKCKPWLWGNIILVALVLTISLIVYLKVLKPPMNSSGAVSNTTNSSAPVTTPKPLTLAVEGVTVISRKPAPNNTKNDEITATVRGRFELKAPQPETLGILAFWRIPSSTANWYMTTTQANGKLQPAVLDGTTTLAGNWNYEIGGISIDRAYQGPLIIVLIAYNRDLIASNQQAWLEQNQDKGFEEIPELQAKADSSAPATFNCAGPAK